jgi:hypothetical protein
MTRAVRAGTARTCCAAAEPTAANKQANNQAAARRQEKDDLISPAAAPAPNARITSRTAQLNGWQLALLASRHQNRPWAVR